MNPPHLLFALPFFMKCGYDEVQLITEVLADEQHPEDIAPLVDGFVRKGEPEVLIDSVTKMTSRPDPTAKDL
jgi:hypothetical protein